MEDVYMLIVKNLKKTYKTKGGVAVHALDDVSVTFPENGLVFLLGKSGSGKSTFIFRCYSLYMKDSFAKSMYRQPSLKHKFFRF